MIDPQIAGLIGAALDAWLPWLGIVAGVAAALAIGRLFVVFLLAALGVDATRRKTDDRPLLFGLLALLDSSPPAPEPEVKPPPAGPWPRRLWAEILHAWRDVARAAWTFVRGDALNPWWRVSWRGLDRAFTRASWVMFFALFFGAFVCAAAVGAGFPLAETAALYTLLGMVWVCAIITIAFCLMIGEASFVLHSLMAEIGVSFGFAMSWSLTLMLGFAAAAARGRAISYVATISVAEKEHAPLSQVRIVSQAEALTLLKGDLQKYFPPGKRRRRVTFILTYVTVLLLFFTGLAFAQYEAASATPGIELASHLIGRLGLLIVGGVGSMVGLIALEYRRHQRQAAQVEERAES